MKTTMKVLLGIILFVFISSNLNAQNQMNGSRESVHPILDGLFMNNKLSAHMPLAVAQLKTTSPYFKVKQTELVKYQLDSLILTPSVNEMSTPKGKIECKYDSLGRMILFYVSQSNVSPNVLEFSYKYVYSYGSNYSIRDEYYGNSGSVNFGGRTKSIYGQNNRIQTIKSGTDTVNFDNNSNRDEYLYENNLLSTINKYYSGYETPSRMTRYFYDTLGRDTAEVLYSVDWGTNIMRESSKNKFYYDVNNDMIRSEEFNFTNGLWDFDVVYDYIYNDSHDCISLTENRFSNSVSTGQLKYISNYNKSILMSDIDYGYTFTDFPYTFKSQLENIDLYMSSGTDFLLMGGYKLYYSESKKSTGIDNTSKVTNELIKFNALSKTIMLQNTVVGNSNQLQLYNLSGKLMLNKTISTSQSVSVEKLGSGLYVYRLVTAGKTFVGKILVQ